MIIFGKTIITMSREFIEGKFGNQHLYTATRQQKQINYFTMGDVQDSIVNNNYFDTLYNGSYNKDNEFLCWVQYIFKKNNFNTFYKYLRNPIPSAKLINDEVKIDLERVFFAEDSYRKYTIKGDEVDDIPEQANLAICFQVAKSRQLRSLARRVNPIKVRLSEERH